ncbi:MAG: thiolase family protein [Candidatus Korarchaeum sp.]|jgi:acetyl-CoA C-acetyltransferase|nr:thiolase family protein [Candidatus Korarchaeum sp.]
MTYIIGAGVLKVGDHWDKSLRNLAAEASILAIEDAGGVSVDYVVVANSLSGVVNGQENLGSYVVSRLNLKGVPALKVEAANASGAAAAIIANSLIKSGEAQRVLVVGVEKMTDYTSLEDSNTALSTLIDSEYEAFHGATLDSLHALLMREYLKKYRINREDFSYFPILMHENAVDTPHAQYRFKIDLDAYLSSPLLAEPISMMDVPSPSDGAAAIVLSEKSEGPNGSARISSFGQATDRISLYNRKYILEMPSIRMAFNRAVSKLNNFKPDLYIIGEYSSVMGYIATEELGLAESGKAYKLFMDGEAKRNGPIPINPEGGSKARGDPIGATGVYQLAEAYLQLTGRAQGWQVNGARRALVLSIGGLGCNSVVHLIEGV